MFGCKPKQNVTSPLENGDNTELDTCDLLDGEGITQYQSLIGTLQWIISIGKFHAAIHVLSLSLFLVAPYKGHLEQAWRIIGNLAKMIHGCIRFRIDEL
jgi:hypothetical protein